MSLAASFENENVLVTGAGGFIGSHLVERLVDEGAQVTAIVEYNRSSHRGWLEASPALEEIDVHLGDVRDIDDLRLAAEGTEYLFHLAALVSIPHSYRSPRSHVDTNLQGTLNALQAAREEDVERVIHTSTSEVYGSAQTVPITEEHRLQAQSPYAASKIGADQMAEAFRRSYELPVITVRPFNTFGPRQSLRAVIPATIVQCLEGDTLELGNLRPTRDFNYVSNTVDGFLAAASASEDALGEVFNLGSGEEVSIRELAEIVMDAVERPVKLVQTEDRRRPDESEVDRLLADASRARKVLGWEPQVGFEEGIAKTVEWFLDNKERYRDESYLV